MPSPKGDFIVKKTSKSALFIKNLLMTIVLPILLYLLFGAITKGKFFAPAILSSVCRSAVYPCLLCMALSLNMSMGMWDFSAGANLYLGALLGGNLALNMGWGIPGIVICCIVTCALVGLLSGLAYNLFKVPSIVLSIGLCMIYEGVPRLAISGGLQMSRKLGLLSYSPYCYIVLAVAFAIYYVVMKYTVFGHNLSIIGANQDVAYRSGINLRKTKLLAYVLSGIYIGISCVVFLGQTGSVAVATNMGSAGVIFDAMMGFFVAGFLARYCGMTIGCVVGVFSMRIMSTGLISCGSSSSINQIFTGFFLLLLLVFSANQNLPNEIRTRKKNAAIANELYNQSAT